MNIELLELAESALGELVDQVVFVGGATVGLWITDPAAPPVRPTDDVDVVVEVTTRTAFYDFEAKLREPGFHEECGGSSRTLGSWTDSREQCVATPRARNASTSWCCPLSRCSLNHTLSEQRYALRRDPDGRNH